MKFNPIISIIAPYCRAIFLASYILNSAVGLNFFLAVA